MKDEYIKDELSAVILAGGQGSRMGYADKGLMTLGARPLVEHIIARIAPQVGTLLINANRNLERYRRYAYPIISDDNEDFMGPLAGMASALRVVQTPYLLVCPCDTPYPPLDLAPRLYRELTAHRADIAVAADGQNIHPVFCLIRVNASPSAAEQLACGERKLILWFDKLKTVYCNFDDQADAFRNINTLAELNELEDEDNVHEQ